MKKTKEMNLTHTNKDLQENIKEIMSTSQRLTQTKTEVQHNVNDIVKLKTNIQQESRNVDICDQLKDLPLGLQYENDIWNESVIMITIFSTSRLLSTYLIIKVFLAAY